MADETLFTSQTPGVNQFDATEVSLGTTVYFALAGVVKAIRFYATPTQTGGTFTGGLYSVDTADGGSNDPGNGTGTLLASQAFTTPLTGGAWNVATFGSPVSVSANTPYRAVAYASNGRYGSTTNLFASDLVNGNITAPAANTSVAGKNIRNGCYNYAVSISYPNDFFSEGYLVDVIYEANATATLIVPRRPTRGLYLRPRR